MKSLTERTANRHNSACCPNNSWENEWLSEAEATQYAVLSLQVLVSVLTVVCNGSILLAVASERHLRTLRHAYLLSLATADFLVGGLVMPMCMVSEFSRDSKAAYAANLAWRTMDVFASTASVWSICCIALERYAAIRQPVYCRQAGTKWKVCAIIAAVWLLSALLTMPALLAGLQDSDIWFVVLDVLFVLVSFVLPAAVTLWVYLKIFRIAYLLVKAIRAGQIRVKVSDTNTAILRVHQGTLTRSGLVSQAAQRYLRNGPYRTSKLVSPDTLDSLAILQMAIPSDERDRSRTISARNSIVEAISVGSSNDTGYSVRRSSRHASNCTSTSNIKATKTLGRVILCFLVALTPKSVFLLLNVFLGDSIPFRPAIFLFVMHLAHANSLLNPLIYSWSLAEFQKVFLRWLGAPVRKCCPLAAFSHMYSLERSTRPCASVLSCTMWPNNNVVLPGLAVTVERPNQVVANS